MSVIVQTLTCCCNCCKRLPDTINFEIHLFWHGGDCDFNITQTVPLVKYANCQKNIEVCCWVWQGILDCGDEMTVTLCCDPSEGDTPDALTLTYSLPCGVPSSGTLTINSSCDCAYIEDCTTEEITSGDLSDCTCCEDNGPEDPDPPPDCCSAGNANGTLHCDLSSTCAAYNGITFDLAYTGTQWEGFATPGDFCGSPCSAKFIFLCVDTSTPPDPPTFSWRFGDGGTGSHVGCDDTLDGGDEDCAPAGMRQLVAPTTCSPLDITLTVGTLATKALCSCCVNKTITARVYE